MKAKELGEQRAKQGTPNILALMALYFYAIILALSGFTVPSSQTTFKVVSKFSSLQVMNV